MNFPNVLPVRTEATRTQILYVRESHCMEIFSFIKIKSTLWRETPFCNVHLTVRFCRFVCVMFKTFQTRHITILHFNLFSIYIVFFCIFFYCLYTVRKSNTRFKYKTAPFTIPSLFFFRLLFGPFPLFSPFKLLLKFICMINTCISLTISFIPGFYLYFFFCSSYAVFVCVVSKTVYKTYSLQWNTSIAVTSHINTCV